MTPTHKSTGIAASLGSLQHLRNGPQPVAASPHTRIPASPSASPPPRRKGEGKRSNPAYSQLKAYIPTTLKDRAMRQAQDENHEDFSAFIQQLLERHLNQS